jgi:hypothetical protein
MGDHSHATQGDWEELASEALQFVGSALPTARRR